MQNKKNSNKKESKIKKFFFNAIAAILSIALWLMLNISLYLTLTKYLGASGQVIFIICLFAQIIIGGPALILWHADFEKSVAPVPQISEDERIEWW